MNYNEFLKTKSKDYLDKQNDFSSDEFLKRLETRSFGQISPEKFSEILKDYPEVGSFVLKDPKKANISEKAFFEYTGLEKLPASGSKSISFNENGDIEKHSAYTSKSADAVFEKDEKYYITQKHTDGFGGAQDNQRADVITFLDFASKKNKAIAVLDGNYWEVYNSNLKEHYKENENVQIMTADEFKEWKTK